MEIKQKVKEKIPQLFFRSTKVDKKFLDNQKNNFELEFHKICLNQNI
ncbi:hypothetical protein [Gloeothece verrucosa]|uniref:Uncharacterized protein n=1 Tax=Gloeothece verrucosa (strain PCC 7822) TaxID=497965 RepID=E0ULA9_GLOV7|nr:hypothetical protein [Gloeothece verrucosa]ADN17739.1 hypothetical protein Cyan7822_5885 [Gloeothece verrucosa PCC 7822]